MNYKKLFFVTIAVFAVLTVWHLYMMKKNGKCTCQEEVTTPA